jgi:predicted dehydrogenase
MTSDGLGVVVVGSGFGCYTHVRTLRAAGFTVQALVGRDPDKTADRAAFFNVPRACASLADALSVPGVDAVSIATPPNTHATLALEAIESGHHVLCEKPLARDAAEARLLLLAAEHAGVIHFLGTEFRYDVGQLLLARAVRDGLIGRPRLATWVLQVPMLVDPAAEIPSWWADAEQGGGWLTAHGSQLIDQIRVTLGEFEGVSASVLQVIERPAMSADDGFVVHFRLCNGVVGVMQSTASDHGILVETRVTGSTGTAWIEGAGSTVRVADGHGVRVVEVPDDVETVASPPLPDGAVTTAYERMITFGVEYGPYVRLASAFRDRILGYAVADPQPATFADGVAQMEVLDAIRASAAAGGTWVMVGA